MINISIIGSDSGEIMMSTIIISSDKQLHIVGTSKEAWHDNTEAAEEKADHEERDTGEICDIPIRWLFRTFEISGRNNFLLCSF